MITRNEESRTVLRELGVPTELGTDTAWTFEPPRPNTAKRSLREVGWDGKHAGAGGVSDQSFRMAGESVGGEICRSHV